MKPRHAQSGFTLIEIAIVLVIIGLLSRFFVASDWARDTFKLDNDGSVQTVAFGVAIAAMFLVGWGMKLADEGRPLAFQRMRDRTADRTCTDDGNTHRLNGCLRRAPSVAWRRRD
jgi:prepilin-type N-terminal cleavage/methylation domain-containing protein